MFTAQQISIFQASGNPKENTDAPRTKIYIYIYIDIKIHVFIIIYICVCK